MLTVLQNALVQAPDVPYLNSTLTITLLPALPNTWRSGSLKGLRVRGAMTMDLRWVRGSATSGSITVDKGARAREVEVVYHGKQIDFFTAEGGMTRSWSFYGNSGHDPRVLEVCA